MRPLIVVRPLDVRRQLVSEIEFLAAEALQHHRRLVLGLPVILQALDSREGGVAELALDLLAKLTRDVLGHVRAEIALEEGAVAADVAEISFDFEVDFL